MKTRALLLLFVFATINAFSQTTTESNVKIEKRDLGVFNQVKAGKGINVTLVAGDKETVVIHIQNGAPSDVLTELNGQTLTLKMKTKIYKDMAVRVYVYYKKLILIDAGSGSSIDCDGAIEGDNITLNADTDSSIEIEVEMQTINATLSASRIDITGTTHFQDIKASAGARYNAGELKSTEAYVKSNTGALVTVDASDKLIGSAATGAQVFYYGNPVKFEKTESIGGKFKPAIVEK